MPLSLKVNKAACLTGHTASIYALHPASRLGFFYSGGSDKVVALWDTSIPDEGKMVARSSDAVYSILEDSQFSRLLVGQASGGIHIINLQAGIEERLLQYHTTSVFEIVKSTVHGLYISLSGDGDVALINMDDLSLNKKLHLFDGKLRCAVFNKDESTIAIGAADGSIYLFSLPGMKLLKKWQAHQEGFSVNTLCYDPAYTKLLSGSRDAHLNVFDVNNNFQLLRSIPAHNYAIYAISYNHRGTMIATASRDKNVKIWDAGSMEVIVRIDKEHYEGHVNSVNKLLWQGNKLITAGDDRVVNVWDVAPVQNT